MNHTEKITLDDLKRVARRAMLDRGLLPDFSAAALAQAESLRRAGAGANAAPGAVSSAAPGAVPSAAPNAGANSGVRDLRAPLWCSIDNDDSRDLDQLSVAQPLDGGRVRVLVAIADVDAAVTAGSAIDDHARTNTTSVYTAAGIFPMLPEALSTDLTSLVEGQERPSIVVEMTIEADGSITQSDVYAARVINRAKLAYDSVAAWLDGTEPAPQRVAAVPGMDAQLRLQDRVAQVLRKARLGRGALRLETIEARAVFENGELRDLRPDQANRAKDLIEDFMVAANGVVARFLQARGRPAIRRILRTPQHWERIVALAAGLGDRLPAEPDGVALDDFLQRRRVAAPDRFADLSLTIVKLLGSGEYVLEMPGDTATGHFGLAVRDYTHSTAPNRRYPDLIAQRLLKAALANSPAPYSPDQLRALAAHCTQQEGNAAKVERQVRKSAAAVLLAPRLGQRFEGIVTGVSDKGTWVRVTQPAAEGRIVRGYEGLEVGDHLAVRLVHTDFVRGFIDFERIAK